MAERERFTWDPVKARHNRRKHGVSFEEAVTIFDDPHLVLLADIADPSRQVAVGYSAVQRVLVVVHLEVRATVRIISARRATRHERKIHQEG
jgi:uncharacterized DUF497 family protein